MNPTCMSKVVAILNYRSSQRYIFCTSCKGQFNEYSRQVYFKMVSWIHRTNIKYSMEANISPVIYSEKNVKLRNNCLVKTLFLAKRKVAGALEYIISLNRSRIYNF